MIGEDEGTRLVETLMEAGIYSEPDPVNIELEDGKTSYGHGYPIKAVEKFLGYYDPEMHIPFNPSISFGTDFSLFQCSCTYDRNAKQDSVIFNGEKSESYSMRAAGAMTNFRKIFKFGGAFKFVIRRSRRYEKAKGLSESAAVAASVSRALLRNVSSGEPDDRNVSRFAKFVSGSGTRAAIPGFSIWLAHAGMEERRSFAVKLPVDYSKFHFAAIPLYTDIATSDMHKLVIKSPLYVPWITAKFPRLEEIVENGFKLSDLMQRSFEEMINLSNLVKSVGREIHTSDTLNIIEQYLKFSKQNEGLYMTTDTGPSAIIMAEDRKLVDDFLSLLPYNHIDGKIMEGGDPQERSDFMKEVEEKYLK